MSRSPEHLDGLEEVLHEIFRDADVGFVLLDLHGTILEVNGSLCRLLGEQHDGICGRPLTEFTDEADQPEVLSMLEKLDRGEGKSYRVQRRLRGGGGRLITTRVNGSIVRSRTGEPAFAIEIVEDIGRMLEAERALRENETRYRSIVEDLDEYIVRWLPDGTRTFVNEAYARYVGLPSVDLIGTSFLPLIPREEDRAAVLEKIAALTPDAPIAMNQHRAVTANGTERWHEWTDRGLFDDTGTLRMLQSVGRDVTAERTARESLESSERRFRRLFRDLPVACWETDWTKAVALLRKAGVVTYDDFLARVVPNHAWIREIVAAIAVVDINPSALRLFGVANLEEYRDLRARWATSDPSLLALAAAELILGSAPIVGAEVAVRGRDGRAIVMAVEWARTAADESDWRVIATAVDVTARRQAERELERHRGILEHAETIAQIGSWEWDASEKTVFGSREYWHVLYGGVHPAETRPDSAFFERIHPEDLVLVHAQMERRAAAELSDSASEFRIIRPDGAVRTVLGRAFFRRDASGRIEGGFGILRDLTEQKAAEAAAELQRQQLIRADKMISLGTLVSGVAHEINNPNHFIMLNASLLQKAWSDVLPILDDRASADPDLRIGGLPWGEMRGESVEISRDILAGAERINPIVSDLKSFARDAEPGLDDRVDLNEVVLSVQRLLASRIRKATSRFESRLSPSLPLVRGNRQRLEQVLLNLIENACDALARLEQSVVVTTRVTGPLVEVEVRDEGNGIPPEHLEHLFDPFFTTKRGAGGTGLGLPIAHRIVSEHGGELRFSSVVGHGTTAVVALPAESRPEGELSVARPSIPG